MKTHLPAQTLLLLAATLAASGCGNATAPSSSTSAPKTPPAPSPPLSPSSPQSATPSTPAPPAAPPTPATPAAPASNNAYLGLRDLALANRVPANFANRLTTDQNLHTILVDWTISKNATATLMCSADGSTSMYTSTGGGFIGAGQHASVREAAIALFKIALESKSELSPVTVASLPNVKEMRFTLVTDSGLLSSLASVDELTKDGHPLAPLAKQVQFVIAAIRMVSPRNQ